MRRKRSNLRPDGFVAILAADVHFPDGGSLKGKRQQLRSLKAGLARTLGASVAEVGYHDLWQRSRLLLSMSCGTVSDAERALDLAESYLESRDFPPSGIFREIIKAEGE